MFELRTKSAVCVHPGPQQQGKKKARELNRLPEVYMLLVVVMVFWVKSPFQSVWVPMSQTEML